MLIFGQKKSQQHRSNNRDMKLSLFVLWCYLVSFCVQSPLFCVYLVPELFLSLNEMTEEGQFIFIGTLEAGNRNSFIDSHVCPCLYPSSSKICLKYVRNDRHLTFFWFIYAWETKEIAVQRRFKLRKKIKLLLWSLKAIFFVRCLHPM